VGGLLSHYLSGLDIDIRYQMHAMRLDRREGDMVKTPQKISA